MLARRPVVEDEFARRPEFGPPGAEDGGQTGLTGTSTASAATTSANPVSAALVLLRSDAPRHRVGPPEIVCFTWTAP